MDPKKLTLAIEAYFPKAIIKIEGDDYHRLITIVSDDFDGLSRLARQKRVHQSLFPFFQNGSLHAVTLHTFTEKEFSNVNDR
jgi:acid stress-induced BolA-like protein IbaG/YrbA